MQKSHGRPNAGQVARPRAAKPKPFTLGYDERKQLAQILRRHQDPAMRRHEVIRSVIDGLERRASDFVETGPAAAANSEAAVREAVFANAGSASWLT